MVHPAMARPYLIAGQTQHRRFSAAPGGDKKPEQEEPAKEEAEEEKKEEEAPPKFEQAKPNYTGHLLFGAAILGAAIYSTFSTSGEQGDVVDSKEKAFAAPKEAPAEPPAGMRRVEITFGADL